MEKYDIHSLLACPDCGGKLTQLFTNRLLGFMCNNCHIVFPVINNIPVILGKQCRNWKLEYEPVRQLRDTIISLPSYIDKTLSLLERCKDTMSWEWEDESYWTEVYNKESPIKPNNMGNDRIWQREYLIKRLLKDTSLKGKVILDVGCGDGQTFQRLMSTYCDDRTLYIAVDISLSGLIINRIINKHINSVYLLCSADYLPLGSNVIDIICYFGILHHTSRKASNLQEHIKLLKPDGFIVLHEAIQRSTIGFIKDVDKSAHEEEIKQIDIDNFVNTNHLEVLALRTTQTVFLTAIMKLFSSMLIRNRFLFNFVSWFDSILMKVLNHISSFFKPSAIMLLLRNK